MPGVNLGQNLGVSPFGNPMAARRKPDVQDEDIDPSYGTGFSPDGNSYQVATDFAKIASDALARYEAALEAEKRKNLSIDSRGIVTSTPVDPAISRGLYESILTPAYDYINGGRTSAGNSALHTYKTGGGGIVGVDPYTGSSKMLVPNDPPKAPDMSYVEKQRIGALYGGRRDLEKLGALATKADRERLGEINKQIAILEAPPIPVATNAPAVSVPVAANNGPTAPPVWANWPQQGSFIGTPGGSNSFSNSVAPFIPKAVAPQATNAAIVKTKSGKTYKLTTSP